jgi:hypothetical protein
LQNVLDTFAKSEQNAVIGSNRASRYLLENTMTTYYSTIQSTGSRASCGGLGRISTHQISRKDIVRIAFEVSQRSGWTAEEHVGIKLIEAEDGSLNYERELTEEELFQASVERLGDDGKIYEVYDQSSDVEMAEYRLRCEEFGLEPIEA